MKKRYEKPQITIADFEKSGGKFDDEDIGEWDF